MINSPSDMLHHKPPQHRPNDLLIDMKHFKSFIDRNWGDQTEYKQAGKSDDGKIGNLIAFQINDDDDVLLFWHA